MGDKNPLTEKVQVGRELDMLVAERVMGWTQIKSSQYRKGKPIIGIEEGGSSFQELPAYSTEIAEAFKVLEKLEECGLFATLKRLGPDGWKCSLALANGFEPCFARAVSLPLAICAAAEQFITLGSVSRKR